MDKKAKSSGAILPLEVCRMLAEHELTGGLYPTHYGIFVKAQGHCERPDGIDTHVLIICESGQGWVRFANATQKILPGDILIIPAGCPHAYGCEAGLTWNINWTHFAGKQAAAFINKPSILRPPEVIFHKAQNIYNEFYKCLSRDMKLNTLITASQILRHLLGVICFTGAESQSEAHSRRSVDKAIDLMQQSLDNSLTLQELARTAGLSISRFSVIFKASTGLSPIEYFNNLKVRHACHYLDTTTLSIGQISELVGIENQHYFSRMFSKSTGISPREYRKLKLQL
jgi:AraC-like DNA-binding protein